LPVQIDSCQGHLEQDCPCSRSGLDVSCNCDCRVD
jgi:hypothetical protein